MCNRVNQINALNYAPWNYDDILNDKNKNLEYVFTLQRPVIAVVIQHVPINR